MKTLQLKKYHTTFSKLWLFAITLSLITLTSCGSDENEKKDNLPDGDALKQYVKDKRQSAKQEFELDITSGGTITGSQGTTVTFPANSLGLNGTAVTGNVTIELVEIYGKSAMVLQNASTKGKKSNGDEEALNSAGEFFLNAKQNGTQLEILTPVSINSKAEDTTEIGQMNIFKAGDNLEDEEVWQEVDDNDDGELDIANVIQREDPVTHEIYEVYGFNVSQFGWTNLDKWYNFSGQLTDLFVDVPDEFNATNSLVYLSYDGETGLANMDTWDSGQQMFTEHFGRIPVGKEVHFIMYATIGDVLHYAIQQATIVDGHIEVINSLQPTTEAELTALIDALP